MEHQKLSVAIFGMGYVGITCAISLAQRGHRVVGVEKDAGKRDLLMRGQVPLFDPGLPEGLAEVRSAGRLTLAEDAAAAVREADVSLICVGTPTGDDGTVHTDAIRAVAVEIGQALQARRQTEPDAFHVVAIRSTSPPGTVAEASRLIAEACGAAAGEAFAVAANPEFLREGSALKDMARPPFTIIGADDERAIRRLKQLYAQTDAPLLTMPPREAELLKYLCNVFHALKVAFANEVGEISRGFGINAQQVMEVFCQDTQLNISPAYLRPGFAFGGSCLPKDVRAIVGLTERMRISLPIIQNILASNDQHIGRVAQRLLDLAAGQRTGMLGLSFKDQSDDLRGSPYVRLARLLLDTGHRVHVCEPRVCTDRLFGATRQYIEQTLPELPGMMIADPLELVRQSPVVALCRRDPVFLDAIQQMQPDQLLIDLVSLPPAQRGPARYVDVLHQELPDEPLRPHLEGEAEEVETADARR